MLFVAMPVIWCLMAAEVFVNALEHLGEKLGISRPSGSSFATISKHALASVEPPSASVAGKLAKCRRVTAVFRFDSIRNC